MHRRLLSFCHSAYGRRTNQPASGGRKDPGSRARGKRRHSAESLHPQAPSGYWPEETRHLGRALPGGPQLRVLAEPEAVELVQLSNQPDQLTGYFLEIDGRANVAPQA